MMIDTTDEIAITGNNSAHVQTALDFACRYGRELFESQEAILKLEAIIEKYDTSKALAAYAEFIEPKKLANKENKSQIVKTPKTKELIKLLKKNSMTNGELIKSLGFQTSAILYSLRRSGLVVRDSESKKWELKDRNKLIKI